MYLGDEKMTRKTDYEFVLIEDENLKNFSKEELQKIFMGKLARVIYQQEFENYDNLLKEEDTTTETVITNE